MSEMLAKPLFEITPEKARLYFWTMAAEGLLHHLPDCPTCGCLRCRRKQKEEERIGDADNN